ncbi:MAG: hypothetical protein KDA76_02810 [Planctomycetaceae bacterium]|nr:hypothetical protein [Planctomycetaceae bacterium]
MKADRRKSRRFLCTLMSSLVVLSLVMSVGPGVLLVNRPTMFLGLPLVYAWGIGWYLMICLAAFVSYFWLWAAEIEGEQPGEQQSK